MTNERSNLVLGKMVIIGNPIIAHYNSHFDDTLKTSGLNHLDRLTESIIVLNNPTINNIANKCIEQVDQSTINRFINDPNWDPYKFNNRRLEFLQENRQTRSTNNGFTIIDDSILEKTGVKIEGTDYHFSNSKNKSINGHDFVSSHYFDRKKKYPLHSKLYRRKQELKKNGIPEQFKTKVELAIELIDESIKCGIAFNCCIFDAWYFTRAICDHLKSKGIDWVSRAKSNRVVNLPIGKKNLKTYIENLNADQFSRLPAPVYLEDEKTRKEIKYQFIYEAVLNISDIGNIKCVVIKKNLKDNESIILVSNRLDWTAQRIIQIYKNRWQIETFYRDAKQNLGLDKYQLRSIKGIERYWVLVFHSYTFLQYCKLFGIFSSLLDAPCRTTGEKIQRFQDLNVKYFVNLIISLNRSNANLNEIYQVILKGKYKRNGKTRNKIKFEVKNC